MSEITRKGLAVGTEALYCKRFLVTVTHLRTVPTICEYGVTFEGGTFVGIKLHPEGPHWGYKLEEVETTHHTLEPIVRV